MNLSDDLPVGLRNYRYIRPIVDPSTGKIVRIEGSDDGKTWWSPELGVEAMTLRDRIERILREELSPVYRLATDLAAALEKEGIGEIPEPADYGDSDW